MKRRHDHDNCHEEHLFGAGLQKLTPLSSWWGAWRQTGRHGSEVAESSTSGYEGSRKRERERKWAWLELWRPQSPPTRTHFYQQGQTHCNSDTQGIWYLTLENHWFRGIICGVDQLSAPSSHYLLTFFFNSSLIQYTLTEVSLLPTSPRHPVSPPPPPPAHIPFPRSTSLQKRTSCPGIPAFWRKR